MSAFDNNSPELEMMMSLGLSREICLWALAETNNDCEQATALAFARCDSESAAGASASAMDFDGTASSDDESGSDGGPEMKMVIVVVKNLNMSTGKIAAQSVHAALASYRETMKRKPEILPIWEGQGETTVCLQVKNDEQLQKILDSANSLGLVACDMHDAGRTEVAAGSRTCCAIGPDLAEKINQVTGKLSLLREK